MMKTAVSDPVASIALPTVSAALDGWDREGAPPVEAQQALANDIRNVSNDELFGDLVRRLNSAKSGFRTLMTGELYALLQRHSILGGDATATRDDAAFARGVATARDSGAAGALGRLFTARALMLDGVLAPGAVPDYLSGLLIGEEFRIALADGLARRDVPLQLIGDPALCERYRRAAALFDIDLPSPLQDAAAHGLWRLAVQAGVAVTAPEETRAC